MSNRLWYAGLLVVLVVYVHNTLPYLTMLPRVNVDEPWLMERGYEVMRTGIPSQPMFGLQHAYLLQVGYGYLLAIWMSHRRRRLVSGAPARASCSASASS